MIDEKDAIADASTLEKCDVLDCHDARYYLHKGYLHRINGPAAEYADGEKAFFLYGKEYSFDNWQRAVKIIYAI